MIELDWIKEFPGAVTVCNSDGIIIGMNDMAARVFHNDGGTRLIGTNALDCHPEPARTRFATMLKEQKSNTYTIEKEGIKKLIHQSPWYRNGQFSGFVEISFEIPEILPHYKRG